MVSAKVKGEETGRVKETEGQDATYRFLVGCLVGLGLVAALTESEALLLNNPHLSSLDDVEHTASLLSYILHALLMP